MNTILNHIGTFACTPQSVVLEYGCDITGATSLLFVENCNGAQYLGLNCKHNSGFPETTIAVHHERIHFLELKPCMTTLPFMDGSIHAVFSDNVLEHVAREALVIYISETHRVLRQNGVAFLQAQPTWGSARGHHIHEDMVQWWARQCNCSNGHEYRNDGSFIQDFSHLHFSEEQFTASILKTSLSRCKCLVSRIVEFVYHENDISRVVVEDITTIVRSFQWSFVNVKSENEGARIQIELIK